MDYKEWLSCPPYSLEQDKKEKFLLAALTALTAYHYQHCPPYARVLDLLGYEPQRWQSLSDIPMLPIQLFKTGGWSSIAEEKISKILISSGTTGQARSRIVLDDETASRQQLALSAILQDFIGPVRLPMLIIDVPSVLKDRDLFSARGAAILGFSLAARRKYYALDEEGQLDLEAIQKFLSRYGDKPFLLFGFTFMIWKHLYQFLRDHQLKLDLSQAIVLHGGGWKRLQSEAVSAQKYKAALHEQCGITRLHNYYGMAEQTGCIYMECEYGHLHASIFSDILLRRPRDFSLCAPGEEGILQVLSPLPKSYPGHSILTEDQGLWLGTDDCPCGRKGKYFSVTGRIPAAEIRGCSDTHGY